MLTESRGFEHSSVKRRDGKLSVAEVAITQLGQQTGLFTVNCTQNSAADFTKENLKNYDLVIFYTQSSGALPIKQKDADYFVNDWLKQKGHGFIGFHSATDTFRSNPKDEKENQRYRWYWEMTGATFNGHPWNSQNTVTITVHDTSHPGMKPFGKEFQITDDGGSSQPGVYSIEKWVEAQIPPQGKPGKKETEEDQVAAYDASVWDWAKQKTSEGKTLYFGEPETSVDWPKYKPENPGERPVLLFDKDTGKLAWPHMKPHFGKRPRFSPDHNPAPFLEPMRNDTKVAKSTKVARPGENGPWSLSPIETSESQMKKFNIHAIQLPITLSKAEGDLPPIVDENGQIFVLHEEEAAIREFDELKIPLVLRMNVGDTVD
ncbi:MAG: ThuA domain-containing protein, partial [Planctomycetes bacterium]|nr:ThuA domain-containing protein [Planctomycetota bacterium]